MYNVSGHKWEALLKFNCFAREYLDRQKINPKKSLHGKS